MVLVGMKEFLRRKSRFCETPRFFEGDAGDDTFPDIQSFSQLTPRALYEYIPLVPRLRLLYANPVSALEMRYPTKLLNTPWELNEDGVLEEGP